MRLYLDEKNKLGHRDDSDHLFESLFKTHERPVFRLALKVTKSNIFAADIVQEVFLKIWEHREEIGHIKNTDAWVTRIVKNKLIDFMRKASADEKLKISLLRGIEQSKYETDQLIDKKESDNLLRKAVEELPEQRRLVYRLNRESGLSYHQIAKELSISKHTVKNHLSLALRFLQKKFSFE